MPRRTAPAFGRRTRAARALVLGGSAALALTACSQATGPGAGEPITELPRELSVGERAVIDASNVFGLELFGAVVAEDVRPNIVLSPLSATMALGMTLNGADGTTFDDMRSTLAFGGLTQEEINGSYRDLIDLLTDLDPRVRFEIANAIWAREGVPFHDAFFQAVRAAFDARVEARDFDDPATVDVINDWVSESTDGLIPSIVESLGPDLVMLLINAIYFDGAWTLQFDPDDTRPQPFTRPDGSTVDVEMMTLRDVRLPMGGGADYTAVELPYGGEAFSMVVLVPTHGKTARELVAGLSAGGWTGVVDGLSPGSLGALGLPKLELGYDVLLNDALDAMGMGVAFTPGADFSRLSPLSTCLSFVRQKTFVEVDERGTRAAAVTAVGTVVTSAPPSLIVDRPFVFALRERLSGTILFIGLVEDPTAEAEDPPPAGVAC